MKTPKHRFRIKPFTNKRTGSKSWRVEGTKRDGTRIRENFADAQEAQHRHIELEAEFFARNNESALRATRLTDKQIRIAEFSFAKLPTDEDMPRAVEHWLKVGKLQHVSESPRIDEAVEKFKEWLDGNHSSINSCAFALVKGDGKGLRNLAEAHSRRAT